MEYLVGGGALADRSTKELVIMLLGGTFPLTTAEVREHLRTRYRRRVSFQAVAKALLDLRRAGILETRGREHRLSARWIGRMRRFVDDVSSRYLAGSIRPQFTSAGGDSEISVYRPASLYATDTLWTELLLDAVGEEARVARSVRLLSIGNVAWWLLLSIGRQTALFRDLLDRGVDVTMYLARGYSLNKWAGEVYGEIGIDVRRFRDDRVPLTTSFNVLHEHVIQVECPAVLVKPFAKLTYPLSDDELPQLHGWGHARGECQITFSRNPVLAEALWQRLSR